MKAKVLLLCTLMLLCATTATASSAKLDQRQTLDNGYLYVGRDRDVMYAQGFVPSITADLNTIEVRLRRTGTPDDNVVLYLYDDAGGKPGASLARSSNAVPGADLVTYPEPPAVYSFDFSDSKLRLTAGTQYWLVLGRTGGTSDYHYYQFSHQEGRTDAYPHGDGWYLTNGAWYAEGYVDAPDGSYYYDLWFMEYYDVSTACHGKKCNG